MRLFALVLTPTRELAYQIGEQFDKLGSGLGVKTCILVGKTILGLRHVISSCFLQILEKTHHFLNAVFPRIFLLSPVLL